MPNGKIGDHPFTDVLYHQIKKFPKEIEDLLKEIHSIGKTLGRYPLGEHWPFSPQEFNWEQGKDLDYARVLLISYLDDLKQGRGDQVMVDPITRKPLN